MWKKHVGHNCQKSRIEKDWKTEKVETLIHRYEKIQKCFSCGSMVSPKTSLLPLVLSVDVVLDKL